MLGLTWAAAGLPRLKILVTVPAGLTWVDLLKKLQKTRQSLKKFTSGMEAKKRRDEDVLEPYTEDKNGNLRSEWELDCDSGWDVIWAQEVDEGIGDEISEDTRYGGDGGGAGWPMALTVLNRSTQSMSSELSFSRSFRVSPFLEALCRLVLCMVRRPFQWHGTVSFFSSTY